MISVNGKVPYITTDFEGNFELKLPKINNNIFISSSWVSIEIKNVPNSKKINIGEITLPMRKSLSVKEYENLSSKEKESLKRSTESSEGLPANVENFLQDLLPDLNATINKPNPLWV